MRYEVVSRVQQVIAKEWAVIFHSLASDTLFSNLCFLFSLTCLHFPPYKKLFPGSKVEIYGSFQTRLNLPTSDIDMVICDFESSNLNQQPYEALRIALIEAKIAEPLTLKVLMGASVPIVKVGFMPFSCAERVFLDARFVVRHQGRYLLQCQNWNPICFTHQGLVPFSSP